MNPLTLSTPAGYAAYIARGRFALLAASASAALAASAAAGADGPSGDSENSGAVELTPPQAA